LPRKVRESRAGLCAASAVRISPSPSRLFLLDQPDRVRFAVDIFKAQTDLFARRRREILADVIGADGQFPMAAIDQGGQLDSRGPAKRTDRVHCRARGSAGE